MSAADELIENAKRIRQRLRHPPNAVIDHGIDLTRKSTAHKGDGPIPDAPIKKILNEAPIPQEVYFPITFEDILRTVATHYGISVEDLKGSCRQATISYARFVVVHLSLRYLAKRSLKSIGRSLGNKDHTSILHARNRIRGIMAVNPKAHAEIIGIEKHIESMYNYRFAVSDFGQYRLAL